MLVGVVRGINMDKDEKKKIIDYIKSDAVLSIGYEEMSEEKKQEYEESVFNTLGFKIYQMSITLKNLEKCVEKLK